MSLLVRQQEESLTRRKKNKKKTGIIVIEKEAKGVKRMYVPVIAGCSDGQFVPFFEEHISKSTKLRTDGWSGYSLFNKRILKSCARNEQ
ncbi:MAG: hypothetical protein ACI9DJ_001254 [Algoriphagus sp.]